MRMRRPSLFFCSAFVLLTTLWPTPTYAQRVRPRVHAHHARSVVFVSGYYSPYFYDPFFGPSWRYRGAYYGFQTPYDGFVHDDRGALRLQVSPRLAEVFIDGYRAGTVDDFDGTFQRLRLHPGDHEVVFYLDGYRTARQQVTVVPHKTAQLRFAMEPLSPGESPEPRPLPPPPEQPATVPSGQALPLPSAGSASASRFGTLSIRVQPADAEVLIDGEPWQTSGPQDRLLVQVGEGRHQVEIRKEGHESFVRQIDVRAGETAALNVSLAAPR